MSLIGDRLAVRTTFLSRSVGYYEGLTCPVAGEWIRGGPMLHGSLKSVLVGCMVCSRLWHSSILSVGRAGSCMRTRMS
jgi:hypothetical protein